VVKVAATINGWGPAGLLDTHQTERHPIAAWVLDWTRAQVALMRGDDGTAQLWSIDRMTAEAVRPLERRVAYVADPASDTSLPSLTVRPGGIIIWATAQDSEPISDNAQKRLGTAVVRWVGAP
jgi:hypothetical protein